MSRRATAGRCRQKPHVPQGREEVSEKLGEEKQGLVRVRAPGALGKQPGRGDARPRALLKSARPQGPAQPLQRAERGLGVREASRAEGLEPPRVVELGVQRHREERLVRRLVARRLPEEGAEGGGHEAPVALELRVQGQRGRKAQASGQPQALSFRGGQGLRLLLLHHLQPVFHPPQKDVSVAERVRVPVGEESRVRQAQEGLQRVVDSEGGDFAAVEQLQGDGEKLHLANAPRPQLHVRGVGLAPQVNFRLQRPERVHRAEVQTAPPEEGLESREEGFGQRLVPGHVPPLHPGRALPGAPGPLVVLQRRRQGEDGRAGPALGPQPQVHPEAEAVLRHQTQRPGEALGQPRVKGDIGEASVRPAGRLALSSVEVHQVHVRAKIQVPPAQLPQPEDAEALRLGRAVPDAQRLLQVKKRSPQHRLGQVRLLSAHLRKRGQRKSSRAASRNRQRALKRRSRR